MELKEKVDTTISQKDKAKPKRKRGDINILMAGGKRTGKTSILASMAQCCMKKLADVEQLSIVRDEDSGIGLNAKYTELKQYFTKKYMSGNPYFVADLQPTRNDSSYGFDVAVDDKDLGYNLCFTDIPGEWLQKSEYAQDLQNIMDISQVIIVAIDTPHLVEDVDPALGYGVNHESFNRVRELTRFFKNTFHTKEHRLVIFVPLKCEKYYYQNEINPAKMGMPMVNEMVKKGYRELIDFLTKSNVAEMCTCAIMPILTLGGAEFFEFDENGYAGLYSYVLDPVHRKFEPQFCEQPLFLTLQYVITLARNRSEKHKILAWMRETFKKQAKLEALQSCESTLKGLIMTDASLGFEILNDPLQMLR